MYRKFLKSKIHRATVTHADLNYEGSITIPSCLLKASDILLNEAVHVWNVTAGTRFETYAIVGSQSDQHVCVNGAAAHLVTPGDIIIIASFTYLLPHEINNFKPTVVFVDEKNHIKELRAEEAMI